jgi:hypothetical protein
MIDTAKSRFFETSAVADGLCLFAAAFPIWALLASSIYLMLVWRLQAFDPRRLWNG